MPVDRKRGSQWSRGQGQWGRWGGEGRGNGGPRGVSNRHPASCGLSRRTSLFQTSSWAVWATPETYGCAKTAGRWWVQLTCLADWPSFILDEDNSQCFRVWTLPTPLFGFAFAFLAWWNKTLLKQWRPSPCNLPHDLAALIEGFRFLSKSSLLSGKKQSWYLYRPRTSWWEKA